MAWDQSERRSGLAAEEERRGCSPRGRSVTAHHGQRRTLRPPSAARYFGQTWRLCVSRALPSTRRALSRSGPARRPPSISVPREQSPAQYSELSPMRFRSSSVRPKRLAGLKFRCAERWLKVIVGSARTARPVKSVRQPSPSPNRLSATREAHVHACAARRTCESSRELRLKFA